MMRKKIFYLLVALQVFVLVGIAASHNATLHFGDRVVLKTEPIDPRDLFYGDYVTLNYEISRLPLTLWKSEQPPDYNDRVYVLLKKSDSAYKAVSIHEHKPDAREDEVVIKAVVKRVEDHLGEVLLNYGIERYYVEEGTGKEIQEDRPGEVAVRVAPWGQVTIEELVYTSD